MCSEPFSVSMPVPRSALRLSSSWTSPGRRARLTPTLTLRHGHLQPPVHAKLSSRVRKLGRCVLERIVVQHWRCVGLEHLLLSMKVVWSGGVDSSRRLLWCRPLWCRPLWCRPDRYNINVRTRTNPAQKDQGGLGETAWLQHCSRSSFVWPIPITPPRTATPASVIVRIVLDQGRATRHGRCRGAGLCRFPAKAMVLDLLQGVQRRREDVQDRPTDRAGRGSTIPTTLIRYVRRVFELVTGLDGLPYSTSECWPAAEGWYPGDTAVSEGDGTGVGDALGRPDGGRRGARGGLGRRDGGGSRSLRRRSICIGRWRGGGLESSERGWCGGGSRCRVQCRLAQRLRHRPRGGAHRLGGFVVVVGILGYGVAPPQTGGHSPRSFVRSTPADGRWRLVPSSLLRRRLACGGCGGFSRGGSGLSLPGA